MVHPAWPLCTTTGDTRVFPPLQFYLISGVAPPLPEQPISVVSEMDESVLRSQESTNGLNDSQFIKFEVR